MSAINIICLVSFLPIAFILYGLLRNEAKPRKNIILGVTLPFQARQDPRVEDVRRTYKRRLGIITLVNCLLPACTFFMQYDSIMLTFYFTWLLPVIILPYWGYAAANLSLKKLKADNGWFTPDALVAVVDVRAAAEPLRRIGLIWFLIPFLLGLAPFVATLTTFGIFPVLYGVNLILIALCRLLYTLLDRQRKDVVDENTALTIALTTVRRYNWGKFWLLVAYLTALCSLGLWLCQSTFGFLLVNGLYISAMLFAAIRTELTARLAQQKLTQESGKGDFVDEDTHWPLGLCYYNPNDGHLMIQNRVGIGTTVNLAKTGGKLIAGFSMLILLAMPFIGLWTVAEEMSPIEMCVTPAMVAVRQNGSSYEIPIENITGLSLLTETPDLRRNYGTNFARMYKGSFAVGELGECEIILDPQTPPFIRINSLDATYVFGLNNAEATQNKFIEIQEVLR